MGKKKSKYCVDATSIYESLVEKTEGLVLKGAKNRYTSMNGNMFSFLTKELQLAVRISDDDRADFLTKYPDAVCIQYDTVMKHYVLVPDSILTNPRQVKSLFKKCVQHAETLKAKPTTKKKVAKKASKKAAPKKSKPGSKSAGSKKVAGKKVAKAQSRSTKKKPASRVRKKK